MKAIVCGGRDYSDSGYLFQTLDHCMKWWKLTVLIHGGAKGADTLADQWGRQNKLIVYEFKADWEGLGKSAGIIRNVDMLNQYPDVVIAFQGGRGTEHMIKISREAAIPVFLP